MYLRYGFIWADLAGVWGLSSADTLCFVGWERTDGIGRDGIYKHGSTSASISIVRV